MKMAKSRRTAAARVLLLLATVVLLVHYSSEVSAWAAPLPDGCKVESGHDYPSFWNRTALLVCEGVHRPERVCIVGGGSSGVHMGWLLRRRGFDNTVLFEKNGRLGGDAWTRERQNVRGDNVTRELGAAFLSPDYYEVRALLARYGQPVQTISAVNEMRFHSVPKGSEMEIVQRPVEWREAWLAKITHSTDTDANVKAEGEALQRYIALHRSLFGEYEDRFPPEPVGDNLALINGTATEFLLRNDMAILQPLMYTFFVLQGMGILHEMPAYYMLKWCSPASLLAGGFGHDSHEYPLAMLPDGYGGLIEAIAEEVQLDVRYNAKVTKITRTGAAGASKKVAPVSLQVEYTRDGLSSVENEDCDILVLSGPITEFVRGSDSGTRDAIIASPTEEEVDLFAPKRAMQFLVSLLDLEKTAEQQKFEALEFWPDNFQLNPGVIVHRDVAYAEGRAHTPHNVGGVQSYSYASYPLSNKTKHWEAQKLWLNDHDLTVSSVLGQFFIDTYLFHYDHDGIMERKPWRLSDIQMDRRTNTLYVGGCASYETVEDSFAHNFKLVHDFFDTPADDNWPSTRDMAPHLEQLHINLPCKDIGRFVSVDEKVWTEFLEREKGMAGKWVLKPPPSWMESNMEEGNCTIWSTVQWTSLEVWKSISPSLLQKIDQEFASEFGYSPELRPVPESNGLRLLLTVEAATPSPLLGAVETNKFQLSSCARDNIEAFVRADNSTFTTYLTKVPSFQRKITMIEPQSSPCVVWTRTHWGSRKDWESIPVADKIKLQKEFEKLFGRAVPRSYFPDEEGLDVASEWQPEAGPRVIAIGGNDLVAYHSLKAGEHDVRGSANFRRFLNASMLLPKNLLHYHPQRYEFWFSSESNAEAFSANPLKYLPAFGGHCTHGIATRGGSELNETLLADGRVAFTCVNTTQWSVINGTLYMNSCGMYADFIKDPSGDIAKAGEKWASWYGDMPGPINDACFQDGFTWGGDYVAGLLPPKCNIQ